MLVNNQFYIVGSDEFYEAQSPLDDQAVKLIDMGSPILSLDAANKIEFKNVFHFIGEEEKPCLDEEYFTFAIPYELDDDILYEGKLLSDAIFELINNNRG